MFEWFVSHWDEVVIIIGSVVTISSIIVKFTPSPKDDEFLKKVIKILDLLALNPKPNAKVNNGEPELKN